MIKMNKEKSYKSNFNIDAISKLRDKVNEYSNSLIKSEGFLWNKICVVLDRLEDTINYLNNMKLINSKESKAAFDFYNFINNAYIVVDCISYIAEKFDLGKDLDQIKKSQTCFERVIEGKGNDDRFFRYIRSLCVVHPISTNNKNYKPYLDGVSSHCCPFVRWSKSFCGYSSNDNRDLTAYIYPSKKNANMILQPLYINDFIKYVDKYIELITKIIEVIPKYNNKIYDKFRKEKIKEKSNYDNTTQYLNALKEENIRRYDDQISYIYDRYLKLFNTTLTNPKNQEKVNKYKNAIEHSLSFLHNSLQNMSFKGFENTGIKDENYESLSLFELLYSPKQNDGDFPNLMYSLGKIHYIEKNDPHQKIHVRFLLNQMKESINKYVIFTNEENDEETIALVYTALYLSSLTNESKLNENIPNCLKYREKLLTKKEQNYNRV